MELQPTISTPHGWSMGASCSIRKRSHDSCSLLLQLTRAASLLKEKVLTDPQLATLLTEVESILTNRPLTHISTDSEDLEVLTPNHILLGLQKQWGFVTNVDKKDVTSRGAGTNSDVLGKMVEIIPARTSKEI